MKIFEVMMIVFFGLAWPSNLLKSWRVRTAVGKSVPFLCSVTCGYISGLIYKLTTGWDWVSWFYLANLLMVSADIALYFRNRKLDKEKNHVTDRH